jgi:hypothetical protein
LQLWRKEKEKEKGENMNNTTKIRIMSYASQPDKDYNYDGDYVDFEGKRYWVSLRTETVEFVGNLEASK